MCSCHEGDVPPPLKHQGRPFTRSNRDRMRRALGAGYLMPRVRSLSMRFFE